jgi:hypothetical protein
MEHILITVSVTARKVSEQEMPPPLLYPEPDFFEKGRTHPFTMAVAKAMAEASLSTDEGCFITFEGVLPMLSIPMKQGRPR